MENIEEKTDLELIALAKENPDFFAHVMERYEAALARYIRRIGQFSNEDVEDLVQEIFIKIYRKLNEYESQLKFSSWIYRIAHNHIVDHFRKASARPKTSMLEDGEWEKILEASVHLEKEFWNKDCAEKIKQCIAELPDNYREVLVLRFVEELEYLEIMDILKKPKGTVAIMISRGKELLAKKMKEKNVDCIGNA